MSLKKSLVVAIALVGLSACSSAATDATATSSAKPSAATAAAFPVTIDNAGTPVEIAEEPKAIVSLSPTATEMLYAIGAGEQVVAVDMMSNFPADAPVTDLSGFEPNVEAIVGFSPDLVVLSDDMNEVVAGLRATGVAVLHLPAAATIDDSYAQLTTLGQATGHTDGAQATIDTMKADIDAAIASIKASDAPRTFYHELDPTLYSITSSTFIGQMYALAGLTNIADSASGAETGYPQLSAEFIVEQNPSFIFLADVKCCSVNAAALAERAGFAELDAVKNGSVVELDDDIASRWGPRTPLLVQAIAQAINAS